MPARGTVVQVTMWNSPYQGNFLASQLALAQALERHRGLGTHLVLAPGGEDQPWIADLDAAGVGWSVLPAGARAGRAHLETVLAEQHGTLVHTHFTTADLTGAAAAATAGVPCIWHMHTGFLGYPPRQRLKDLWKIRVVGARKVARAIAVGPWLAELARRRGMPADRVVTVPNAIVLERFDDLPTREQAREHFGLAADATVALGLCWWPSVKGADVLLGALDASAAQGVPITALLVGEEELREAIAERYPAGPPEWLVVSPFVPDPAWLYAAADVFVSASRHEGFPYSLGEAMACGLPAIMSDIVGTRFYGGAEGVTSFPTEDSAALAAELTALVARPAGERAELGARNAAWVREHLAIEQWCASVLDVYDELLPAREPVAGRP
ncbi:MAG TPA: glycosyltransferase family 4 protein [Baekduia sp.]